MPPVGYKHTPEARAKISAAIRGRPHSPEHTAKINTPEHQSAASRARWARPGARERWIGNTFVRNAVVIGECVYCGGPAQTRDHVIPRGRPGYDDLDNLVPACFRCNDSKNNRTPEEWLEAGLLGRDAA